MQGDLVVPFRRRPGETKLLGRLLILTMLCAGLSRAAAAQDVFNSNGSPDQSGDSYNGNSSPDQPDDPYNGSGPGGGDAGGSPSPLGALGGGAFFNQIPGLLLRGLGTGRPGAPDDSWRINPAEARCNGFVGPAAPKPVISDAQQLASLIFGRYRTGAGVGIVRVTNFAFPTCLVVIQGTEFDQNQSTALLEDIASATGLNDNFRRTILSAIGQSCPAGSALILAGHSLGGMEAQLVASDPWLRRMGNYWPLSVITFGSPKLGNDVSDTVTINGRSYLSANYQRFSTIGDPIPFSTIATGTYQHYYPTMVDDRSLADQARAIQWYGQRSIPPLWELLNNSTRAHMWYPCVNMLRGYDALGHRIIAGQPANELHLDLATWRKYKVGLLWSSPQLAP